MKYRSIIFALIAILTIAVVAQASDQMLNARIDQVTVATDRNGNEYVRLVVLEPKTLEGVSYVAGTPVMCFGSTAAQAKNLKKGDMLEAIVTPREYQGRSSYTLRAFK